VTTSAQTSSLAPGLKYGLLAGAGMTAWLLICHVLGVHTKHLDATRYTDWVTAAILVLALGRMLHHLLYSADRYWLPVWVGLLHCALASLVASMVYYVAFSLYLHFLNPNYADYYLEWRFAVLRAAGEPERAIGLMAREFRWSLGPVGLPITIGSLYLLIGLFASPIITLWLNWRRKEVVNPR
jgi:hypothetical protein